MGYVKYTGKTQLIRFGLEFEPGETKELPDPVIRRIVRRMPDVLKPADKPEQAKKPETKPRAKPQKDLEVE